MIIKTGLLSILLLLTLSSCGGYSGDPPQDVVQTAPVSGHYRVYSPNYYLIYFVEETRVLDRLGKTVYYIDGIRVFDLNHYLICYLDSDKVRNTDWTVKYFIKNDKVYDLGWNLIYIIERGVK